MNRFEQLIEYVINDEEQKARELFHEIVVEKSREIYENLMQEDDLDEAKHDEELDEELDEAKHDEELDEAEEMEEAAMGGDAQDDLIDEVETDEEQDMSMEAAGDDADDMGDDDMGDDGMDMGAEGGSEPATKDDIMNLEDKLDELMAEFEAAMGDGDDMGADEGGDAIEVDDTEEMMPMAEAINLKQVHPKVTTHEEGDGHAGPVAFNSGKAGMASKPVHTDTAEEKGRSAPSTKDLIGDFQNRAGASMKAPGAAAKPHLAQATGVNTKSPLPGGRKG